MRAWNDNREEKNEEREREREKERDFIQTKSNFHPWPIKLKGGFQLAQLVKFFMVV